MIRAVSKKIFGVVSDGLAQRLSRRSDIEGRSLSSLVSYLLETQMKEWVEPDASIESESHPDFAKFHHVVLHHMGKLVESGKFPNGRLKELMASGNPPTEVELLRVALICGLSEDYLASLSINGGAKNATSRAE